MIIEDWSSEFLRSQKWNSQVRDWQRHLFKRPRDVIQYSGAGTLTCPTAWGYMDAVGLKITLETTGRPVLLRLQGTLLHVFGAAANHETYFDIVTDGGIYASTLDTTQKANGAYRTSGFNTAHSVNFCARFVFPTLEEGIYIFRPRWYTAASGITMNTNQTPVLFTAEEI